MSTQGDAHVVEAQTAGLQAEIDAHLALEADELRAQGLRRPKRKRPARRALGNRASVEERFYESGRWILGQHLVRDLRFAARVLMKDANSPCWQPWGWHSASA